MNIIKGKIKDLHKVTSVSSTDNNTNNKQIAAFKLEGKPITINNSNTMHFIEGDEVIIAAQKPRGGVYEAYAYNNLTHKIHWVSLNNDIWLIILGLFLIFILSLVLVSIGSWIAGIFGYTVFACLFISFIKKIIFKRKILKQTLLIIS